MSNGNLSGAIGTIAGVAGLVITLKASKIALDVVKDFGKGKKMKKSLLFKSFKQKKFKTFGVY